LIRRDPISGRLVAIAPGRASRPGAGHALIEPETQEELDACPFCAGREDRTPPETRRLPEGGEDWVVRVVPNLYPALERHEVVIHSPRHVRLLADLTDEELDYLAQVVEETDALWLVNEGRLAGSSLPHSHSQLAYGVKLSPEEPAGVEEVLGHEDLRIVEGAVVHWAGRLPYEMLIDAREHRRALFALRECVSRLQDVEGPVPWNAWLHRGEAPHIELVPRLTVLAGLELGAGIYVNSLDPAEAAARLR
jgi:UDPglucose--hexose-1-phosphate uridylyltransferase